MLCCVVVLCCVVCCVVLCCVVLYCVVLCCVGAGAAAVAVSVTMPMGTRLVQSPRALALSLAFPCLVLLHSYPISHRIVPYSTLSHMHYTDLHCTHCFAL